MAPWPYQLCPHPACLQPIRDLLAEMIPSTDQAKPEFKSIVRQTPGGAITCPYCQGAVEYDTDGKSLVVSAMMPLRYSKMKMTIRAKDYGDQLIPPKNEMTPEQWIAEEKLMPGALHNYNYVEDLTP